MMDPFNLSEKLFRSASEDASDSSKRPDTPQTLSSTYHLAFTDEDFMLREELRPVRLQLELLKPELALDELGIRSTVVVFGGARLQSAESAQAETLKAEQALAAAPEKSALLKQLKQARRTEELSNYYEVAREFGHLITKEQQMDAGCRLFVVTGGGPGIMEAANRGASDAGGKSIGLNIVLPFEQCPNAYVTPELCFQFHYFAIRKMHFLMRAKAMLACPGGFGTLDELFETLTLIQTGKIKPLPIMLLGKDFWSRLIDFDFLVEEGLIAESDLDLFVYVETAEEALDYIKNFYQISGDTCI